MLGDATTMKKIRTAGEMVISLTMDRIQVKRLGQAGNMFVEKLNCEFYSISIDFHFSFFLSICNFTRIVVQFSLVVVEFYLFLECVVIALIFSIDRFELSK